MTSSTQTTILDLPVELLFQIFSYLDLHSFLSLTSTCKALHKSEFQNEPTYWSSLVRSTFRVANQPVVEQDGERWKNLYKRMLTQSRIYTWGNNDKGCLGHSHMDADPHGVVPRVPGMRRHVRRRPNVSWPEMMQGVKALGVISDLQCGGWSTTLLTSKGALYTVGVINGMSLQRPQLEPTPLQYPPGFAPPWDRYEPATAIRQFSAGRAHVLALADSGRIWSWEQIGRTAYHVKFLGHDTVENSRSSGKGVVRKVVAGWNKSACLIEGTGIVVWEPLKRPEREREETDTALVTQSAVVEGTDFVRKRRKLGQHAREHILDDDVVGEVLNFVLLEEVMLFNTHSGKVFAAQIHWDNREQRITTPIELPVSDSNGEAAFVTDVQGSFTNFAVFTSSGAVLTSKQDRLLAHIYNNLGDQALWTLIPALQNTQVIQLTFGDYHLHALHSPGHITSYGVEPQHCGALGLGGPGPEGRLRGLRYQNRGDTKLVPHAYTQGRRVWFEKEKRRWVEFLVSGGVDPSEAGERMRLALGSPGWAAQGEVSEWVEQEGRDWEGRFGVGREGDEDDFDSGAYFALSVSAAGWHSGALVLVNKELAQRTRRAVEVPDPAFVPPPEPAASTDTEGESSDNPDEAPGLLTTAVNTLSDYGRWALGMPPYNTTPAPPPPQDNPGATPAMAEFQRGMHPINYGASPRVGVKYVWADDHFPRLVLSDGTEMPGSVGFDGWRFGRPEWDLAFEY